MANTNFVDGQTPIVSSWLNEVNGHVWNDSPVTGTIVHDASKIAYLPDGISAVPTTVRSKLRSLELADYTALRAFTGNETHVQVIGTGIAGLFKVDVTDTTSADNGGTILVDANGRRWKRDFDGLVNAAWFDMPSGAAAAINTAAAVCRATGAGLKIPPVATYHTISTTVDLSDIYVIDGSGAELRGTFSGTPAAIIGGTSSGFRGAEIYLKVRNTSDESAVAGTKGIKFLSFSNSRLTIFARGFEDGMYFDGASGANRVWVDNEIRVLELYNNGNQVHFDMAGISYAVKIQFIGGSYYMGVTSAQTARGTYKLSLAGSGLVSDILVQSPEIGVNRASINVASHGFLVYATVATTWDINTIDFRDTRVEGYGSWSGSDQLIAVNIASNTSGRIGVDVEFSGSFTSAGSATAFVVSHPPGKFNKIRLLNKASRPQNQTAYPQIIIPERTIPYQTSGRCYIPGRVIYDDSTGYAVPVDYLTTGVGSNSLMRANGDGELISGVGTNSYGLIYSKSTSDTLMLELHSEDNFSVICWDSAGNILSGNAPYYAVGAGYRSVTRGSVGIYELDSRWLWLHKSVASFYIGGARWSSNGKINDIAFSVIFGSPVSRVMATKTSPRNLVSHTSPTQCAMPVGTAMEGAASNGWRSTFYLRTTSSAQAASAATTIDLTTVAGISAGDVIGIEIDTEIATGLRRYQWTTVSSVSGSTVTLGAALAANVTAGRAVLVGRWAAR